MSWKNQSGITLVELLAAIAIMSIIIFPILTLMTNSSNRTTIQGKESQMLYFAQEVMETYRVDTSLSAGIINGSCSIAEGCLPDSPGVDEPEVSYEVIIVEKTYEGKENFYDVSVRVESLDVVASPVELVTVVRR